MHKSIVKLLALLLAALLATGLAACGEDTPPSSDSASQSSSTQGGQGQSSSASIPEPEPEPEPLNQAYLTGLPKDANYPEGKRIAAVMLNNVPDARPQNGIGDAKILVEIKVEYNVTRFMALFDDYSAIPRTGGLRSARDQFFQLIIPSQALYVHEGPAEYEHPVNILMRDYTYQDLDITRSYPGFYVDVDSGRSTKNYNWYDISADGIEKAIEARGLDDYKSYNSPIFHFVSYHEEPRVPAEGTATMVEVGHEPPYYVSYFDYDAATRKYGMSMHNSFNGRKETTIDNNTGEQVLFDNVIVLFAPFSIYTNSYLPKVDYTQGGGGFYFSQGGWERFVWRKGAPFEPLQLYDFNTGELLQVNTGTSYLAVVDDKYSENFYQLVRSGQAGQSQGGVDTSAELPED